MAVTTVRPSNDRLMLSVLAVLALLWFAEDVLVPLALATLLSFLLAPLVNRLQCWGVPRILSVLLTALFAFTVLAGVLYVVGSQFLSLAESLPQYKSNLVERIQTLRSPAGGSLQEGKETIEELSEELQKAAPGKPDSRPVQKVQVVDPPPNAVEMIRSVLGPLVQPLGTAAVVIVFVIFMLLQREDLRDRLIALVGVQDLHATTQAMDDAAARVSRFLLMQLLINGMQGIAVAVGLWLIGVPNAALWGALTTVLRFIPYVGPWLAAMMPIALSFAVFEGWAEPLMTIGLFVVLETVSNNFLEPWLYGTRTGVSQLALLVAAVFWTWLWGAAGLFLSTPMTVCLVVMGKYIPQLAFLSILLSDEPVLKPAQRFYQRLLARDPEEAEDLLDELGRQRTPLELCDEVLVPTLQMAEQNHQRGLLDEATRRYIVEQTGELGAALYEDNPAPQALPNGARFTVLNLPAADEADEAAARLFGLQLAHEGIDSRHVTIDALKVEMLDEVGALHPNVVCISALPPAAMSHARYLCKRLRARFPDVPIVVGLWGAEGDMGRACERLKTVGCAAVFTGFADAVDEMKQRRQHVLQGIKPLPARTAQGGGHSVG